MAEQKTYSIPYRSALQERIEPGQTVIIKGSTIDESQRFTINLHSKAADFSGNDVPLHVSVRFDEGKVVFNSFSNGEWGKEERKSIPIKRGEPFDIRIRAHDDRFQIFFDQKEFKDYEHRLPLSSVSHFSIDGDLYVNHISWGGKYYPIPYESGISGGFGVGKKLLVFGTPEKKAKSFNINLLRRNGDISLHFNPRFNEKHIIRNALQAGEWGNEEREGKLPLEKGVGFDLVIVNENYGYQIFINNERFATFAHRDDPNDITGLQIQGDVEVTGIQIQ
uniref:Galectin n=1 Tax=Panagrellus redivivus TaxID=6233 RepID=A0A7E4W224_PANRE